MVVLILPQPDECEHLALTNLEAERLHVLAVSRAHRIRLESGRVAPGTDRGMARYCWRAGRVHAGEVIDMLDQGLEVETLLELISRRLYGTAMPIAHEVFDTVR